MTRKLTFKDYILLPLVFLTAVIVLPLQYLFRKMSGKPSAAARLVLTAEELALLEQASKDGAPVFVNDRKVALKPFDAHHSHVRSSCGSCPDDLYIDEVSGRACLSATREQGQTDWSFHAMVPVVWGLFGYVGSDLMSLRIGDQTLGRVDDNT